MKLSVYILAGTCFVVGTVELVIGGLISVMATDLSVPVSKVGQLITVYSLAFALAAPQLVTVTANVDRKRLYLAALAVFLLGNVFTAVSPTYGLAMVARVVLAASASLITVLSLSLATQLVAPSQRGRALGVISMGISASLVFGVPLGILIGDAYGWRTVFLFISVLSAMAMVGNFICLPRVAIETPWPFPKLLQVLQQTKIWSAHLIVVFMLAGHLTLYAYLTPFLQSTLQLSPGMISVVYFVFGLAAVAGGGFGGWLADRWRVTAVIVAIIGVFLAALVLLPVVTSSLYVLMVVLVVWSMLSWAITPAQQQYLIQIAPETRDIQLSVNTSSSHLGIALGSAIGGIVIDRVSVVYNAWAGAVLVAMALLCAVISLAGRGTLR